jgi:glucose/arabinose dehydrogenase
MLRHAKVIVLAAAIAACADDASFAQAPFTTTPIAEFNEPWAMAFLPDGRLLVTEKRGALKLYSIEGNRIGDITGVPAVEYAGQGGFGDVVLHPDYAANGLVYLSYAGR